jgi:LPPG:FO 2-phospho-L-lactate transferase
VSLVVLAGGVGAARFLQGLVRVVPAHELVVVGNSGDDLSLHGLHISPDLDTITYTLGGGIHPERGWGRAGDTFAVLDELRDRYAEPAWFGLGDRDLATHLVRSRRLAEGAPLSTVTAELARAWGLEITLVPMTDDTVGTRIATADGRELGFQQWWVGEAGKPQPQAVWLAGAHAARPAPGVLGAIADAEAVLVCPSNPVVSIGTILSVPGIRDALHHTSVVGVSPIVGGAVVRGMADRLLPAVGSAISASAVAAGYADFLDGWVLDVADAELAGQVGELGLETAVTETVMATPETAAALAETTVALARTARRG